MSRKASAPDWEFQLAKNERNKVSELPENSMFVEILFKRKAVRPLPTSPNAFFKILTKEHKLDKQTCGELLAKYDSFYKRAEKINQYSLGGNVSQQKQAAAKVPSGVSISKTPKSEKSKSISKESTAKTEKKESKPVVNINNKKTTKNDIKTKSSKQSDNRVKEAELRKRKASSSPSGKCKTTNTAATATATATTTAHKKKRVFPMKHDNAAGRSQTAKGPRMKLAKHGAHQERIPRTSCFPTVGELTEYLNHARSNCTSTESGRYQDVSAAFRESLLQHYADCHFTTWLEALQLDRNLLLYGCGCKQALLRKFAREMLQEEDVLELSASWTSPSLAETDPLDPAGASSSRESRLESLFGAIRRDVLGLKPDGRVALGRPRRGASVLGSDDSGQRRAKVASSSMEGFRFRFQGEAGVLVEEAVLLSDMLRAHYQWRSFAERSGVTAPDHPASSLEDCDSDDGDGSESLPSRRDDSAAASAPMNVAYDNSIGRLYVLLHSVEDLFPLCQESFGAKAACSEHQLALSVLASCPVVSIIASCSAVTCPINLQWDQAIYSSCQWLSFHTPTFSCYDLLPDVLLKCEAASSSGQSGRGRSSTALRYILRSLTRKHCEILKHIIKMQERSSKKVESSSSAENSKEEGAGNSLFGSISVKPAPSQQKDAAKDSSKNAGVKWNELLIVCTSKMITKNDIEMRKLIAELVDQRIIKAYREGQSMMVGLLLSADEVEGALSYFDRKA